MESRAEQAAVCPPWAAQTLDTILGAYRRHFDIQTGGALFGTPFAAMASFRSRGEKYVLSKKAKLWAVECFEHVLFFTVPHLDLDHLQSVTELLERAEGELVHPHAEHMYTYLSAVVLYRQAEPEALRALRRYKLRKNYRLSLHGWCHIRLAALDPEGGVTTNYDGKELKKTLGDILRSGSTTS